MTQAIRCMLIMLVIAAGAAAEMREWKDSRGRQIRAELVDMTDGTVTLRRADGTEGTVERSELSVEDQNYLTAQEYLADQEKLAEEEKKKNAVSIDRRKIMVNNEHYLIKGVCYNPVPQGSSRRNFDRLSEDLALMVEAGINTIRVYSPIDDKAVLDEIDAAGLKVIMGIGYGEIRSGSFIDYVNTYKDHGAILFWELGNEYNYHPEWFDGDIQTWYTAMNRAARQIHLKDPSHPVATAHGEIPDENALSSCPNIDVWGINAYRWDHPATIFPDWKDISSKPMYLSETGADSYMIDSAEGYDAGENEKAQADAVENILDETFGDQRICSGVTLFAFVDEWWKAGNDASQDADGMSPQSSGVPYDGAPNEEYWGIVDIDRKTKEAYEVVKEKYNALR